MSYTIPILNDLHELYPDILYHPSRFQSGEDVINYIVERGVHLPYEQEYAQYQTALRQREEHEQLEQRLHRLEQQVPQVAPEPVVPVAHVQAPVQEDPRQNIRNARLSGAPIPRELLNAPIQLTQQQLRSIEDMEREVYGAVVWRPHHDPHYVAPSIPESQSSITRLLTSLIEDGIMSGQRSSNPLRPTADQLRRSTTIRTLTDNAEDLCHICHDGMLTGQSVRTIRHCNHMFHQLCIDTWFSMRPTCPACRHDVRNS